MGAVGKLSLLDGTGSKLPDQVFKHRGEIIIRRVELRDVQLVFDEEFRKPSIESIRLSSFNDNIACCVSGCLEKGDRLVLNDAVRRYSGKLYGDVRQSVRECRRWCPLQEYVLDG